MPVMRLVAAVGGGPGRRGRGRQRREDAEAAVAGARAGRRQAHEPVVRREGGGRAVRHRGAHGQPDAAASTRPADQRRRELERVARVPVVARGGDREHVVQKRQLERSRLRLGEARAGEAHVDDARLAPDRDVDPRPACRTGRSGPRCPATPARRGSWCARPRPGRPGRCRSSAAIRPVTNVPWPTKSVTSERARRRCRPCA